MTTPSAPLSQRAAFWLAYKTADEAIRRHREIIRPHNEAIAALQERQELLQEAFGIEIVEWCELCGAPLTEDKACTYSDDAGDTMTYCRLSADGEYTDACQKADIEAARRAMHEPAS